jgi:large subunit ribosomal protein L15
MKLHDLQPAAGSHRPKTRVGRGIAAGKGKTAGRGTKGQKARAGGSIPPWFEGGQTPLHMRIPKLRGFKNRGKVEYEVVNVGDISARVEAGAFAKTGNAPKKGEAMTINADVLRAVGLVRDVRKPLKVLGGGELATALFVVADAFTKSATEKIEAAGGSVNVLEVPAESRPALGVDRGARAKAAPAAETPTAAADAAPDEAAEPAKGKARAEKPAAKASKSTRAPKATAAPAVEPEAEPAPADAADAAEATDEPSAADPADAPDAVAETVEPETPAGDDTESDSAVPGDDA